MSLVTVKDLSYVYSPDTPFAKTAITDVNLSFEKGEMIGIIGHTGSGKSTLIQHLNGLIKPTSGQVLLDGKDIWAEPKKIREVRFRVGLVFQYPEYQLFADTAYEDIAFGPKNMGLPEEEIDRRVRATARMVGVTDEMLEKSPFDLSGGEKRRVAIAGVMAMEPEVLVLDEPTAGLDPAGRDRILSRIREYREQTGATVLLVSHSMEDTAKIAEKVLVMNEGRVFRFGSVEEVYSQPEELSAIGLNVPQVTRIFMGLRQNGLPVPGGVYTVEQAKDALLPLLRKGGGADA
ncbi:MAG TPA: energy-coupling factor transporter ATPase [Firmicutes bacterium]|nr:energy-coupling factor transporter ATPase [Bacillota bacterium]